MRLFTPLCWPIGWPVGLSVDPLYTFMTSPNTIHSNYRPVVLSSTLDFLLVLTLDGLFELGSSFKEIFLVAPYEKNP